jgi:hypothetical protein
MKGWLFNTELKATFKEAVLGTFCKFPGMPGEEQKISKGKS